MSKLTDFFEDSTKEFSVTVYYDDTAQDISSDTVTLFLKQSKNDTDANVILEEDADVTTSGATGIAIFSIDTTESDIAVGSYYYEILWITSASKEFVIDQGIVNVKNRISDET